MLRNVPIAALTSDLICGLLARNSGRFRDNLHFYTPQDKNYVGRIYQPASALQPPEDRLIRIEPR